MQVPAAHITDVHVKANIAAGLVTINVSGTQAAQGTPFRAVVSAENNAVAIACGSVGSALPLAINSARLWSPASPFLYDLVSVPVACARLRVPTEKGISLPCPTPSDQICLCLRLSVQ